MIKSDWGHFIFSVNYFFELVFFSVQKYFDNRFDFIIVVRRISLVEFLVAFR